MGNPLKPTGPRARWLGIAAAALLLAALALGVLFWRRSVAVERRAAVRPACPVQCERFPTVPADACVRTCERVRVERSTLDFSTSYGECAMDCLMQLGAVMQVRGDAGSDEEEARADESDARATEQKVDLERRLVAACADRCVEMRARPHPPAARPNAPEGGR